MPLELVVDANVLFSALLAKKTTRGLFFNPPRQTLRPRVLLEELEKHLESDLELRKKLRQTPEETKAVVHELKHSVEVISSRDYAPLLEKALEISPDEYDAPYFALALFLEIPLWSNDKRLKKQEAVKVLDTKEVLELLNKQENY